MTILKTFCNCLLLLLVVACDTQSPGTDANQGYQETSIKVNRFEAKSGFRALDNSLFRVEVSIDDQAVPMSANDDQSQWSGKVRISSDEPFELKIEWYFNDLLIAAHSRAIDPTTDSMAQLVESNDYITEGVAFDADGDQCSNLDELRVPVPDKPGCTENTTTVPVINDPATNSPTTNNPTTNNPTTNNPTQPASFYVNLFNLGPGYDGILDPRKNRVELTIDGQSISMTPNRDSSGWNGETSLASNASFQLNVKWHYDEVLVGTYDQLLNTTTSAINRTVLTSDFTTSGPGLNDDGDTCSNLEELEVPAIPGCNGDTSITWAEPYCAGGNSSAISATVNNGTSASHTYSIEVTNPDTGDVLREGGDQTIMANSVGTLTIEGIPDGVGVLNTYQDGTLLHKSSALTFNAREACNNTRLASPNVTSSVNGATLTASWEAVPGATSYDYRITRDGGALRTTVDYTNTKVSYSLQAPYGNICIYVIAKAPGLSSITEGASCTTVEEPAPLTPIFNEQVQLAKLLGTWISGCQPRQGRTDGFDFSTEQISITLSSTNEKNWESHSRFYATADCTKGEIGSEKFESGQLDLVENVSTTDGKSATAIDIRPSPGSDLGSLVRTIIYTEGENLYLGSRPAYTTEQARPTNLNGGDPYRRLVQVNFSVDSFSTLSGLGDIDPAEFRVEVTAGDQAVPLPEYNGQSELSGAALLFSNEPFNLSVRWFIGDTLIATHDRQLNPISNSKNQQVSTSDYITTGEGLDINANQCSNLDELRVPAPDLPGCSGNFSVTWATDPYCTSDFFNPGIRATIYNGTPVKRMYKIRQSNPDGTSTTHQSHQQGVNANSTGIVALGGVSDGRWRMTLVIGGRDGDAEVENEIKLNTSDIYDIKIDQICNNIPTADSNTQTTPTELVPTIVAGVTLRIDQQKLDHFLGVWVSACQPRESAPAGQLFGIEQLSLRASANQIHSAERFTQYYPTANCTKGEEMDSTSHAGWFTLGGDVLTSDGLNAVAIDYQIPSDSATVRNIIWVNDDSLHLGLSDSAFYSNNTRPTALNFDDVYQRSETAINRE